MQPEDDNPERAQQIQRAFNEAVREWDVPRAERLLRAGADVNAPGNKGQSRVTPLMFAVESYVWTGGAEKAGALRMMDCLLAHGANPNIGDREGTRPLHYGAGDYSVLNDGKASELVQKLLAHGADPRLRDADGDSAAELHHRCINDVFGDGRNTDVGRLLDAHNERLTLAEHVPAATVQAPRRRMRL